MENTQLRVIDIETDVVAVPTKINFDKQKYIDIIDQMPLDQLTTGFFKKIENSAIKIDESLYAPIKAWRLVVKEIIAHGQSRIAELKRIDAELEVKRVAEKTAIVTELILKLKADLKLPQHYMNNIGFKTEFLLKGKSIPHIEVDILEQIEVQKKLYQAELDAIELQDLKIKNRELLIDKLNKEYGFTYTYSDFTIDRYNDDNVKNSILASWKRNQERVESEAKAKAEAQAKAEAEKMAQNIADINAHTVRVDKPHSQLREEAHARQEATEQLRGEIQEAKAIAEAQAKASLWKPDPPLPQPEQEKIFVSTDIQLKFLKLIELSSDNEKWLNSAVEYLQVKIDTQNVVKMKIL